MKPSGVQRARFSALALLTLLLSICLLPLSPLAAQAATPPATPDSTTYPDAVLADHPVQDWRLGDSATGVATDYSSFGRDGTYAAGVASSPGGIAGDTNGAISGTGYMVGGEIDGLPVDNAPRTMELWFRTNHLDGWQTVARYGDGSVLPHSRFQIALHDAGWMHIHSDDGTYIEFRLPRPVSDGQWHLYDATFDGTNVVGYMDGQPIGSGPLPVVTTGTTGLRIGNYNGDYDEVAVYPSALNNKQIETHWTRGNSTQPTCLAAPTTGYAATVVADKPAAYYRLGDQTKDPTTRVAFDSSGNCNNGALSTAATPQSNSALLGDPDKATSNAGAIVATGTREALPSGSAPRTMELWFRTNHLDGWQTVARYGDGSPDAHTRFQVALHDAGWMHVHSDDGTYVEFRLPRPVTDGQWHLYDATFDGTNVVGYMDGQPVGSGPLPVNTIGGAGLQLGNYNGDYDDTAVYPTALNNKQIENHWTRGESTRATCLPTPTSGYGAAVVANSPSVYYRLGDQSVESGSRVAFDSSGNCNNGALSTSATPQPNSALLGDADKATSNPGVVVATGTRQALPSGSSPRTIELWFRSHNLDGWQTVARYGDGSPDPRSRFQVALHDAGWMHVHSDDNTYTEFRLPRPVVDGQWHLYDVTFDGSTVVGYMDGQPVGSAQLPANTTGAGGLQLGNYHGDYDDAAVYPSALNDKQIESHWTVGASTRGACVTPPTSGYGAAVLANQPSVYYRLGDQSAEPGSHTAYDSSGNCNNGAYSSSATAQSDSALLGDTDKAAANPGVVFATGNRQALPSGSSPRTVEMWFRSNALDGWQTVARYGDGNADAHSRFQVALHDAGWMHVHSDDQTYAEFRLPNPVSDGQWHLYDVTFDGSNVTAYMDGQTVGTAGLPVDTIGAGGLQLGNYRGDYDEVAIYPSALNPSTIAGLWSKHFQKPPTGVSLVSATAGQNSAGITWTAADGNGLPITSYVVTAIENGHRSQSVATPGNVLNAQINGLPSGHTYTFEVVPNNDFGPGATSASNSVAITSGIASTYSSTVLSDTPSGYYRYSEQSGSVVADSSGNNRSGNYNNANNIFRNQLGAVPREQDPAAALAGSTAYLASTTGSGVPVGSSARSFETWVRTASTGPIGGWGNTDSNHGFIVGLTQTGLSLQTGTSTQSFNLNAPLTDSVWHHVVITYDGVRTIVAYVDGKPAGNATLPSALDTTPGLFYMGGFGNAPIASRTIDETAVYDHVLDSAAVSRHYGQAMSGNHAPDALLEVTPNDGAAPLDVVALAHSFDADGDHTAYTIDFGDGTITNPAPIASIASAGHRYNKSGQYIARLRVYDGWFITESTVAVTVRDVAPNAAPTLEFGIADANGIVPFTASFTTDARDADGDALTYSMDFGDGSTSTGPAANIPLSHTYTRTGTFAVRLSVTDGIATTTKTVTVVAGLSEPLFADAGDDMAVVVGKDVRFSGAGSRPSTGIDSYRWDFGDGATSNEASPSHVFNEPGTYTVALTVTAAGETKTDSIAVKVLPVGLDKGLSVTVKSSDGALITGADVSVVDSTGIRWASVSDASGVAVIPGLADGDYTVYGVAGGFLPASTQGHISNGTGATTITLQSGQIATTQLDVRRLTTSEIIAAGIDPTNPDNNFVSAYTIELATGVQLSGYTNNTGFVGCNKWAFPDSPDACATPSAGYTTGGYTYTPRFVSSGGQQAIVWMVLPAVASFQKEFFEARFVVNNLASTQFTFHSGWATLTLPDGVTLAPTATPQSPTVSVADVPGGGSASSTWILRGDKEGAYTIDVDYAATLEPVGTSLSLHATNAAPFKVWGASALETVVEIPQSGNALDPVPGRLGLHNVSDIDVANAQVGFFSNLNETMMLQPQQQMSARTPLLKAGETLWLDFVAIPRKSGAVDPAASLISESAGGAAPKLVVHTIDPFTPHPLTVENVGHGFRLHMDPEADASLTEVYLADKIDTADGPQLGDAWQFWPSKLNNGSLQLENIPIGQSRYVAVSLVVNGERTMRHAVIAGTSIPSIRLTAKMPSPVLLNMTGGPVTFDMPVTYENTSLEDVKNISLKWDWIKDRIYPFPYPAPEQYQSDGDHIWVVLENGWVAEAPIVPSLPSNGTGTYTWKVHPEIIEAGCPDTPADNAPVLCLPEVPMVVSVKADNEPEYAKPFPIRIQAAPNAAAAVYDDNTIAGMCHQNEEHMIHNCRVNMDPVNTANGNFVHEEHDVTLSGFGMPLQFTRTYNSLSAQSGRFGLGWSDAYDEFITKDSDNKTLVHLGSGQVLTYTKQADGTYSKDAFISSVLKTTSAGTELVTLQGKRHIFDSNNGRLLRIVDTHNNTVSFGYNSVGQAISITDTTGRVTSLAYNTGTVSKLTTPDGRSVSYTYGTTANKRVLTSSTDMAGRKTTYTYDAAAHLTQVIDPNSKVQVRNVYSGPEGRVAEQYDQLGNKSSYSRSTATQTSTFTDAAGATFTDTFRNNVLMNSVEPSGTTSYSYDKSGATAAITQANGTRLLMAHDSRGNMTSRTVSGSNEVEYFTYDANNLLTSSTNGEGQVTRYTYNAARDLVSVSAPDGTTQYLSYDTHGQLTSSTDAAGRVTNFTYDKLGNRVSEIDPLVRVTRYTYDAAGLVSTVTDPSGARTAYTYDAEGRLLSTTDPLGNKSSIKYDRAGNAINTTDALGRSASFTYNNANEVISATSPNGATYTFTYDGRGKLIKKTQPRPGSATGSVAISYTYDLAGHLTSTTDAAGRVTKNTYDPLGRITSTTDAIGGVSRLTYDNSGRLVSTTDPAGNVTSTTYDKASRKTSVTDANGARTAFEYDANGRPVASVDAIGGRTSTTYDAAGNVIAVTDPTGRITRTTYDAANQVIATFNAARPNDITRFTYDKAGHITRITDPLGNSNSSTYDLMGRTLSTTDAKGAKTSYSYDALGHILSVTAPDNSVTTLAYDNADNIKKKTDALGHSTNFSWDLIGNLLSTTAPGGQTSQYTYDAVGNTASFTDARSIKTTYTYDARNLPVKADYSDATPDITMSYDALGRRTQLRDGQGEANFAYDAVGRMTTAARNGTQLSQLVYAYDAVGRMLNRIEADGGATSYAYDAAGRVTSLTGRGTSATYTYDPSGRLSATTFGNGITQSNTYDAANRLTSIATTANGATRSTLSYTYDAVANPTKVQRTGSNPSITTNSYDNRSRLTSTCFTTVASCSSAQTTSYTYDAVGNRLTQTANGQTTTNSYNNADELTTSQVGKTKNKYTYDAAGNLLSDANRTFTYDAVNRLTSINTSSLHESLAYDGDNNLATITNGTSKSFITTDVNTPVPQAIALSNNANAPPRHYVDGIATVVDNPQTKAVHYNGTDALGSLIDDTDALGTQVRHRDYQAFGATSNDTDSKQDVGKGFAGEQQLDTGLINLRARIYDPTTGRFLTRDPLGRSANEPLLNAYSYTDNKPTTQLDPLGLRGVPTTTGDICSKKWGGLAQSACEQNYDPLSNLQKAKDFTAGYADSLTYGLSSYGIEYLFGDNWVVNRDSGAYHSGGQLGDAIDTLDSLHGILKKAEKAYLDDGLAVVERKSSTTTTKRVFNSISDKTKDVTSRITSAFSSKATPANRLVTGRNKAVFWTRVDGGQAGAEEWAKKNGGTTLSMLMEERDIPIPQGDAKQTEEAWAALSTELANGASGDVRVLQQDQVNINSFWVNYEWKPLRANPNVTSIRAVDPRTGVETLLWKR